MKQTTVSLFKKMSPVNRNNRFVTLIVMGCWAVMILSLPFRNVKGDQNGKSKVGNYECS